MRGLGVAVVGAGSIAGTHLDAYAAQPDADLVAVVDRHRDRAERLAAAYGIGGVHTDLDAALADDRVQAVSICTANESHADLAVAALDAGRHVLVEKPLSTSVEGARRVAAAATRNARVVQVGFVRRFSGNVTTLKRFIDAGDLGEVYYARASNLRRAGHPGGWYGAQERSGGGPLIDIGSHVLDLAWYLMGRPEPVTVSANRYARLGERAGVGPARYRATEPGPAGSVEDLANAVLRFANGASLLLDASYSLHALQDRLSVRLHGDLGGAEVEPELVLATERHGTLVNLVPQIEHRSFDLVQGFRGEIDNFVQACLGREAVLAPVQDGLAVTRMVAAAYASADAGREVLLPADREGEGLSEQDGPGSDGPSSDGPASDGRAPDGTGPDGTTGAAG